MLQQTQVERVVPGFERFVAAFPDFASLAKASRADVVRAW
jgi:A/G-specific adenine glycosylase